MVNTSNIKPRLLVTTDIGGDPDDAQSMIRLLCYSNEFELEGLIATCLESKFINRGYQPVNVDLILERVEAYGQVFDNLKKHAEGFPSAEYLLGIIKSGTPSRDKMGEGFDSEASEWIIQCVDKDDPRPLCISVWGGAIDIAQAVWKVKNTRSKEEFEQFISKIRIFSIGKQDVGVDSILSNALNIHLVLTGNSSDPLKRAYRGFYDGGDDVGELTSSDWIVPNVQTNHGPLGALYPLKTNTFNGINCLKEGDTISFLYFMSERQGLGNPAHPDWGSWGGRYQNKFANAWMDAEDMVTLSNGTETSARATVFRWRRELQNDFAARMDWCVADTYTNANHNPIAVVNGKLQRTVSPGEIVTLDATGSYDPDGDELSYEWIYYKEAGTYGENIDLINSNEQIASFVAPAVTSPKILHFILKVKDSGSPILTGYKRVIVTVVGK